MHPEKLLLSLCLFSIQVFHLVTASVCGSLPPPPTGWNPSNVAIRKTQKYSHLHHQDGFNLIIIQYFESVNDGDRKGAVTISMCLSWVLQDLVRLFLRNIFSPCQDCNQSFGCLSSGTIMSRNFALWRDEILWFVTPGAWECCSHQSQDRVIGSNWKVVWLCFACRAKCSTLFSAVKKICCWHFNNSWA